MPTSHDICNTTYAEFSALETGYVSSRPALCRFHSRQMIVLRFGVAGHLAVDLAAPCSSLVGRIISAIPAWIAPMHPDQLTEYLFARS